MLVKINSLISQLKTYKLVESQKISFVNSQ